MSLANKTIIVTGASSGLGKAMADEFVSEGATVIYASFDRESLDDAVDRITEQEEDGEATGILVDVRSWDQVRRLVQQVERTHGAIDVFVNNAGVTQYKINADHSYRSVAELPIETWDTVLDTNLRGVFLCSKAVLPPMISRDSGRIIHVSSGHGGEGRANRSAYVASKFALEGFHESLAKELDEIGVDSIAFRPPEGGVYTESSNLISREPESYPNESPTVICEAAVQLACGEGENGGRYKATADGEGYAKYKR